MSAASRCAPSRSASATATWECASDPMVAGTGMADMVWRACCNSKAAVAEGPAAPRPSTPDAGTVPTAAAGDMGNGKADMGWERSAELCRAAVRWVNTKARRRVNPLCHLQRGEMRGEGAGHERERDTQ